MVDRYQARVLRQAAEPEGGRPRTDDHQHEPGGNQCERHLLGRLDIADPRFQVGIDGLQILGGRRIERLGPGDLGDPCQGLGVRRDLEGDRLAELVLDLDLPLRRSQADGARSAGSSGVSSGGRSTTYTLRSRCQVQTYRLTEVVSTLTYGL